jgi:antitoxin (DNA-binding transcriptional repressor) of toxin-antitoxin stability system
MCLRVLDEVRTQGKEIVITKRGKPVARLLPVEASAEANEPPVFGRMAGTVKILGDIVSPIGELWDADC